MNCRFSTIFSSSFLLQSAIKRNGCCGVCVCESFPARGSSSNDQFVIIYCTECRDIRCCIGCTTSLPSAIKHPEHSVHLFVRFSLIFFPQRHHFLHSPPTHPRGGRWTDMHTPHHTLQMDCEILK